MITEKNALKIVMIMANNTALIALYTFNFLSASIYWRRTRDGMSMQVQETVWLTELATNKRIEVQVFAIVPLRIEVFINFFLFLYISLFPRRRVPAMLLTSPIAIAMNCYSFDICLSFASRRKISAVSGAETLISLLP